jgi:hypothetical protein
MVVAWLWSGCEHLVNIVVPGDFGVDFEQMKKLEPSPSLCMSFSQRFDGTMKRAEEVAQKRIDAYVCDPSAIEAIEARPELVDHLDWPSFMSSFPRTTSATDGRCGNLGKMQIRLVPRSLRRCCG